MYNQIDVEDIGDGGGDILNLRLSETDNESCEWSANLGLRAGDGEALVCCKEEQIVKKCSDGRGSM